MTAAEADPAPTILLVDGDLQQTMTCKLEFESQGYRVVCTHSGREALELFGREHIDVVIAEVLLSDMPGLDFIENVAARHDGTPIVVNTAHAGCRQNFRCWAADAIVDKSPDCGELQRQVDALLRKQPYLN
jgi:DNA-binding response OmpR family regulator